MGYFRVIRLIVMAAVIVAAAGYLVFSAASLMVAPNKSRANTTPIGAFHLLELDGGDSIYNWDFKNTSSTSSTNVDWGMRFIFAGNVVSTSHVKNKLDGEDDEPAITPVLEGVGSPLYAWLDDGPQQLGSNWDSDWGIKNYPGCAWNWGHMRVYAQAVYDHNYNPAWGNYVVASSHVDHERPSQPIGCDKKYKSLEIHEDKWVARINDSALAQPPYNWNADETYDFRNGSPGGTIVYLGNLMHKYQSDGWGRIVRIQTQMGGSGDGDDK